MSTPMDAYEGERPLRPRPVVAAAVAESVMYGLMARHAYEEALPAAVPLTLGFIFLVPAIAGYRVAASSDAREIGTLTPAAALLMVLAAAVALGGPGIAGAVVLMPLFMLMALLGGMLACMVRGTCRAATRVAKRLARATASRRVGGIGNLDLPATRPGAERNRASRDVGGPEVWRQVIIRTPPCQGVRSRTPRPGARSAAFHHRSRHPKPQQQTITRRTRKVNERARRKISPRPLFDSSASSV